MEIFWGMGGPGAARDVVATRSGRWFDPALAHLVSTLTDEHPIWTLLASGRITPSLHVESEQPPALECTPDRIDRIAQAFALIIDGKSPYTFSHSDRVAGYAVSIAERLGCDATFLTRVRRAALVHDLGKLTIPNSILDSPQPLTADEWQVVRRHPAYTFEILQRVPVMTELALDAASHHERLDGRGYHRGVSGAELSLAARILALADVTDALAADRPYRPALGPDEVLRILRAGSGSQFCPACVDVCTPDFVVPPVVAA
jgi:HD-GYP domain-containing protein (c-di-GMP phosphodiesterase class II)